MPVVSEEMFNEAIDVVIKENSSYIPPYGSGGSLYLRPFLFGHGAKLGLGAAPKYLFGVLANPVGSYYKSGVKPVKAIVLGDYDRAAPRGVGHIKVAGNYAPDVKPSAEAAEKGYPIVLYLGALYMLYPYCSFILTYTHI